MERDDLNEILAILDRISRDQQEQRELLEDIFEAVQDRSLTVNDLFIDDLPEE